MMVTCDFDGCIVYYDLQKDAESLRLKIPVVEYVKDKKFIVLTGRLRGEEKMIHRVLERAEIEKNCIDILCINVPKPTSSLDHILQVRNWKAAQIACLRPNAVIDDDLDILTRLVDIIDILILVRDEKLVYIRGGK